MPIPKKARRVTLAVLAAAGALLISSCLEPPVSYSQTNPGADVADPSLNRDGNLGY